MPSPDTVFAYGTLQPGQRYAHVAQRIGLVDTEPATLSGFVLYHLEPEGYPAIVPGSGTVTGTALTFADIDRALPLIDQLEGCDQSPPLYIREVHTVNPAGATWVYVYNRVERLHQPGATHLPGGTWPPDSDLSSQPLSDLP